MVIRSLIVAAGLCAVAFAAHADHWIARVTYIDTATHKVAGGILSCPAYPTKDECETSLKKLANPANKNECIRLEVDPCFNQ